VVLAITPMVLFLGGSVNPSGVEVAAGVAFAAVVMGAARSPDGLSRRWRAAAFGGAVLILSRPFGGAWAAVDLVLWGLLVGPRQARTALADLRGRLLVAVLGAAFGLQLAWRVFSSTGEPVDPPVLAGSVGLVVSQTLVLGRESIGVLGWLDTTLPTWLYAGWLALGGALFLLALRRPTLQAAGLIGATLAAAAVAAYLIQVTLLSPFGVRLQARYPMPLLLVVPVLVGELAARRGPPPARWAPLVPLVLAGAAGFQLVAVVVNARRQGMGSGPALMLLSAPSWSPPGGWAPWLVMAALGSAAMALGGTAYLRHPVVSGDRH
jgi:hypothetical protein